MVAGLWHGVFRKLFPERVFMFCMHSITCITLHCMLRALHPPRPPASGRVDVRTLPLYTLPAATCLLLAVTVNAATLPHPLPTPSLPGLAGGLELQNCENARGFIRSSDFSLLINPYFVDPRNRDVLRTKEILTFQIRGSTK